MARRARVDGSRRRTRAVIAFGRDLHQPYPLDRPIACYDRLAQNYLASIALIAAVAEWI